jgi:hypothetical protein
MRHTPHGGLLPALVTLLATIAIASASPATAATRHDSYPLHGGSAGTRVAAVQWLVSGHRQNVFTKVKPTLKRYTAGVYGARTKAAVKAYKFRIGYPAAGQCPSTRKSTTVNDTASVQFVSILEGRKQRPVCWVAVAQQRLKLVEPGATKLALVIKAIEISQLGHHERSWNCGPTINGYFAFFGLPCGLAWCEIFQAWAFAKAGYVPVPFALGAVSPFGVISTEQWFKPKGVLNAKAKVGSLVAFLDDGGHIGFVTKVTASGYSTVEGNEGDAVKQVWHPWNDRLRIFIDLPGVA